MANKKWIWLGVTEDDEEVFDRLALDEDVIIMDGWVVVCLAEHKDEITDKYGLNRNNFESLTDWYESSFGDDYYNYVRIDDELQRYADMIDRNEVLQKTLNKIENLTSDDMKEITFSDLVQNTAKECIIKALRNKIAQFESEIA